MIAWPHRSEVNGLGPEIQVWVQCGDNCRAERITVMGAGYGCSSWWKPREWTVVVVTAILICVSTLAGCGGVTPKEQSGSGRDGLPFVWIEGNEVAFRPIESPSGLPMTPERVVMTCQLIAIEREATGGVRSGTFVMHAGTPNEVRVTVCPITVDGIAQAGVSMSAVDWIIVKSD